MRVGILGGGQLGRMLALAGYPLDVRCRFLDPAPDAPAGQVAEMIVGDFAETGALARFAAGLDVVTYEFENVPTDAVAWLASRLPVLPPLTALRTDQDRLAEKQLFRRLDVPTADFAAIDDRAELAGAIERIGEPAVLKTRRLGYDGKGQRVIRDRAEAAAAWDALGGVPLLLERFVEFDRELSLIAVRGRDGQTLCYPLVENEHTDGILRRSFAPARGTAGKLQRRAERYAALVLDELEYVGVLAIEFFAAGGDLIANEMAPRVHNSAHWTIEGAVTSQFENHLRAVLGLPLGETESRPSGMLNVIGSLPDANRVLAVPGAHLHMYGKAERPGRKLGHVTVTGTDPAAVRTSLARAEAVLEHRVAGS